MTAYEEIVARRGITRLIHFTKSSNLPFILGDGQYETNGIVSTEQLKASPNMEILDKRRLDHHENYVCCSVQEMNSGFFKRRQAENLDTPFSEWAVLSIDPSVITDSALFCPVNAATGNGRYIQGGAAAFEGIFAPHLEWRKADGWQSLDRSYQRANQPTNNQAEVLIKDRIPRDKIIGVAFPASSYEVECKRMQFWYTGNIMKERLEGI